MSWRRLLSVYPTVIADNDTVCSCDCFLAWQFPCAFSRYSTLEADRDLVSAQCGKDDVPYGEEYVDSTTPWQSMCERDAIVMRVSTLVEGSVRVIGASSSVVVVIAFVTRHDRPLCSNLTGCCCLQVCLLVTVTLVTSPTT